MGKEEEEGGFIIVRLSRENFKNINRSQRGGNGRGKEGEAEGSLTRRAHVLHSR
jgi:hypothetical protein